MAAGIFGWPDRFLIGAGLVAQGRRAEAIPILEQALAIHEKAHGLDHHETVSVLQYYSDLQHGSGPDAGTKLRNNPPRRENHNQGRRALGP